MSHSRYAWFDSTPIVYSRLRKLDCDSRCCAIALYNNGLNDGWTDIRCRARFRALCQKNGESYVTRFDHSLLINSVRYNKYLSTGIKYYLFRTDIQMTYSAAQEYCHLLNATLLKVISLEELNWVDSVLGASRKPYWLATSTQDSNHLSPIEGGNITIWPSGYPNSNSTLSNNYNAYAGGRQCNRWNFAKCDTALNVICESKTPFLFAQQPRKILKTDISLLHFLAFGKVYYGVDQHLNYHDAVELCDQLYAKPVMVAVQAEHEFIKAKFQISSYWTNYVTFDRFTIKDNFTTSDAVGVLWNKWRYKKRKCNWFCCAVIVAEDDFLMDVPCNTTHQVVCQKISDRTVYENVTACYNTSSDFSITSDVVVDYASKMINDQVYLVSHFKCNNTDHLPVSSEHGRKVILDNVCRNGRWYLDSTTVGTVSCYLKWTLNESTSNVTWMDIVEKAENITIVQTLGDGQTFRAFPITTLQSNGRMSSSSQTFIIISIALLVALLVTATTTAKLLLDRRRHLTTRDQRKSTRQSYYDQGYIEPMYFVDEDEPAMPEQYLELNDVYMYMYSHVYDTVENHEYDDVVNKQR